jgi:hypothetical protein
MYVPGCNRSLNWRFFQTLKTKQKVMCQITPKDKGLLSLETTAQQVSDNAREQRQQVLPHSIKIKVSVATRKRDVNF